MLWRIGGKGDGPADRGMGIKLTTVLTGSVSRFARSNVWQKTACSREPSPSTCVLVAAGEPMQFS